MKDSAKEIVGILLDVLAAHGVRHLVCSPGSRNAPLLIGAEARKELKKHVIIDERSAAFTALGISQVSQEPVGLICTSGTALLNYAPAIAEAFYQGLPLIVISADRPLEWIDQDDSQTIRQPGALANFVKGTYSISDREQGDRQGWYETRIANDAMLNALSPKQGPVHINVRLSPPLGEIREVFPEDLNKRIIRKISVSCRPDRIVMQELASRLTEKKVLIVCGFMQPGARMNKAMLKMRMHKNVVILAETISNLHLPPEDYAVDTLFSDKEFAENFKSFKPDIIISAGGALISRKLKEYLRICGAEDRELEHWSVGFSHTTVDCFQALTLRIDCSPSYFFAALSPELARLLKRERGPKYPEFARQWNDLKNRAVLRTDAYAASAVWSDMKAFHLILNRIPGYFNLFLSNGTSIRYAQILTRKLPHAEYCNRGVSGIDGSTSTAIGGSLVYWGQTLLITGDMSFAYDLSAMQTLRSLDSSLKIIVINNGGGGIFRFIPATSSLEFRERYFCADPELSVAKIADAFNLKYFSAESESQIIKVLPRFLEGSGSAILEVKTPQMESAEILKGCFQING